MSSQGYTVTSLFSGAGGLDLGFIWQGFKVTWANDLMENAVRTYNHNLGNHAVSSDILEMPSKEVPSSDVLIGGPPCQAFSLVGYRKQGDPRGQLVFKFLDIVAEMQPKAFVMENVPGIESSKINDTPLVDYLMKQFTNLGYKVSRMKLTATDYLVPQLRKRVVLIGSRGGLVEKPDPLLYASNCFNIDIRHYDLSAKGAIGDLGPCSKKGELATYSMPPHNDFTKIMRASGGDKVSLHECPRMSETDELIVRYIPPGGNYRNIPDEVSTGRMMKFKATGGRTTTYGRLHPDKPSHTINTYFRRPNVGCNFHYEHNRLITPREAMRFQSFPDNFELIFSSQDERNTLIGNAVPPLMGRALAWAVQQALDGKTARKSAIGLDHFIT